MEIKGKNIEIKPLGYLDMIELEGLSKREFIKKMILLSTNLTEEEVDAISMKEGTEIQNLINEINGFGNFQNPDKKE